MDEKWSEEQITKILAGWTEQHELSQLLDEIRAKNTESVQSYNKVSSQLEEMTKEKELLQSANINLINENARLFAKQPTKVEDSNDPSIIENNEGKEVKTLDSEGIQSILENGLE